MTVAHCWTCGNGVLQGKYINDPEVLREAAEKAEVKDADQVLSDANVARDQVSVTKQLKWLYCSKQPAIPSM